MSNLDWSNPVMLSILGLLVLLVAISFLAVLPVLVRGLLRIAVLVIIIAYILQYTGLMPPLLPSFQEIGEHTVRVTKQLKDRKTTHRGAQEKKDTESSP